MVPCLSFVLVPGRRRSRGRAAAAAAAAAADAGAVGGGGAGHRVCMVLVVMLLLIMATDSGDGSESGGQNDIDSTLAIASSWRSLSRDCLSCQSDEHLPCQRIPHKCSCIFVLVFFPFVCELVLGENPQST